MVMNGCAVVVVVFVIGFAVDCVISTTFVVIGSFNRFVTGGLLVVNVTFRLINGRTGVSVTRLVGFVTSVAVVGRFDDPECDAVVVVGLRVAAVGLDVVVVTRTLFFVVDAISFSDVLLATTLVVGLCRFVGFVVVVDGLLLVLFVLIVVEAVVVVVTASCTD